MARVFAGERAQCVRPMVGGLWLAGARTGGLKFTREDAERTGHLPVHTTQAVVAGAVCPTNPDLCLVVTADGCLRGLSLPSDPAATCGWSEKRNVPGGAVDVAWLSPTDAVVLTAKGVVLTVPMVKEFFGFKSPRGLLGPGYVTDQDRYPNWLDTPQLPTSPVAWTVAVSATAVLDCYGAVWWRNPVTRGQWHRLHTTRDAAGAYGRKVDPGPAWGVVKDLTFVDSTRLAVLETHRSDFETPPTPIVVLYNANDPETHTKWAITLPHKGAPVVALAAPRGTHGVALEAVHADGTTSRLWTAPADRELASHR
jgi:hypothetical protein